MADNFDKTAHTAIQYLWQEDINVKINKKYFEMVPFYCTAILGCSSVE